MYYQSIFLKSLKERDFVEGAQVYYNLLYDFYIMNLYQFMLLYQDVFNPKYFLLFALILIVIYDWKNSNREIKHLFGRFAVVFVSYITGLTIMDFLLQEVAKQTSNFQQYFEDFSAMIGLSIALILCILLWKMLGYGMELICGAIGLIFVIVPYTIISYFWNISGHVTFTVAPSTYLVIIDKRFFPLYIIPVIMVFNRPIVGAHDPVQSFTGFIFGILLMLLGVRICYGSKSRWQKIH